MMREEEGNNIILEENGSFENVEEPTTPSQKLFVCDICQKVFSRKGSMIHHQEMHNSDNATCSKLAAEKARPYSCNICDKKFTAKKNLLKHLRIIHKDLNEAEKLQVKKTRCPEKNCLFTCRKVKDLRSHIEKSHEIKILKDTLQFTSEAEFQKWKKEEETNSVSWFVAFRRKSVLSNGNKKQTLSCHRTGQYNPKGAGKHKLKSHGSCKIGGTCPAAMEVTEFQDGQLSVVYYKTHLGHSQEVVHLQLSREERAKLLERIEQGFSLDAILEDIKESIDPLDKKPRRIHLLSRKDLYNIMQSFNNKKMKEKRKTGNKSSILSKAQEGILLEEASESSGRDAEKVDTRQEEYNEADLLLQTCTYSNHDRNFMQISSSSLIQDFNSSVNQYHKQICSTSKDETTSQVVIVSPNLNYRSVTEVILVQPTENLTPLTESNVFPTEIVTYDPDKPLRDQKDTKKGKYLEESKNKRKSSNLSLKLQSKVEQIFHCLPKSEFLTPKQFELINSKLDSIISIYDSVKVKTKSKKLSVKKQSSKIKTKQLENWQENVESGVSAEESPVQNVQQSPIYAYLCNFN